MFKNYVQNPICHIPVKIEKDSEVELIDVVVDWLNIDKIIGTYRSIWQNAYNPRWMIKILFLWYMNGIRSSKVLAQLCKKHIDYMYLIGNNPPSDRTIREFRRSKLTNIKKIFTDILSICIEIGVTKVWKVNIDGSKFKAKASSKQTKDIKKIDKELLRIKEIRKEINKIMEEVETEEDKEKSNTIKEVFSNKKIANKYKNINIQKELTKVNNREEKLKKTKKEIEKRKVEKLNITDNEANFMRTSEWKTKPAYNVQVGSNNQVIQDYEVSVKATDNGEALKNILEGTEKNTKKEVKELNADAWYSTEKNLKYMKERKIDARVPDTKYYKLKKWELNKFDRETFGYDEKKDEYICPNKNRLKFKREERKKEKISKRYEANKDDCQNCPLKKECIKGKIVKFRSISVNSKWETLKKDMRKKLDTEEWAKKYQERMSDVEPIFWNIKHNKGFRWFTLEGKVGATIEMWIIAIVHNLTKIKNFFKKTHTKSNFCEIKQTGKELCLFYA